MSTEYSSVADSGSDAKFRYRSREGLGQFVQLDENVRRRKRSRSR